MKIRRVWGTHILCIRICTYASSCEYMILTNCWGEYYVWRDGQVCIRLVCEARKQERTKGESVYSYGAGIAGR
jgi:hypothetical protein